MKKLYAALFSVLALSACSSTADKKMDVAQPCPPAAKREAKLDAAQYKPYEGKGTARINGRVCVDVKGKEKCLANQLVVINPVTDYSTEWFKRYWKENVRLEPAGEVAMKHNRMTKTDAQGYFSFTDLQPGSYYVGAEVCPPCMMNSEGSMTVKEDAGIKYQRLGAKVTMKKSIKADLKPVYTP